MPLSRIHSLHAYGEKLSNYVVANVVIIVIEMKITVSLVLICE